MDKYHIQKWHLKLKIKYIHGNPKDEWEEEIEKEAGKKNKNQPLEKTSDQPQRTKTRIHRKTNQNTKPSNTKSQNEYDDDQDEPQKWPRNPQVQILLRSRWNPGTHHPRMYEEHERRKNIRYAEVFKENNIETNRAIARAPIEINQKINENQ